MTAEHAIRVALGPSPGKVTQASGQAKTETSAKNTQPAQTPFIDIHEGPDGLVLEADLPGVSQDNVTINLEDNVLTLSAKVGGQGPVEGKLLHEEYRHGDFHRSFILSDEVDRDKISAELKNGVLKLHLPKAERAKTRRIEIKSS